MRMNPVMRGIRAFWGLAIALFLCGGIAQSAQLPDEPDSVGANARLLGGPMVAPEVTPESAPATPAAYTIWDAPLGFAGASRIEARDAQTDENAVPIPDRWRIGFPIWDRYGNGHPWVDDYPYVPGHRWDPFNQNVLKGDYPIYGQHLFLEITASTEITFEGRQTPTAATVFESTANPGQRDLFGNPNQYAYFQNFFFSIDLFHGDASFQPVDWRIKLTPAFNVNYLAVNELGVVSPNVNEGTTRGRTFGTLQEWFGEVKLFDIGSDYDFVSVRAAPSPLRAIFAASSSATSIAAFASSATPSPTAINSISFTSTCSKKTPTACSTPSRTANSRS